MNRKALMEVFEKGKIESIVIINSKTADPNFTYITDFASGLFEGSTLAVEKSGKMTLLTSELEYETARSQAVKGMKIVKVNGSNADAEMEKIVRGKRIGINGNFLPVALYKKISKHKPGAIKDISDLLVEMRSIKTEDEIMRIRKASRIVKKAMHAIKGEFREGITELQLAAKFNYIMQDAGAQGPSFETIVAFGKNAAMPHHSPDSTRLRKGDLVLIDAGARFRNYCSDVTRTFVFKRSYADKKALRMLEVVKEAQRLAINAVSPGIAASKVHIIAEDFINSADNGAYRGRFIHSLGHSVGIEVHDGVSIGKRSKTMIKEGMVFTVEPGIYIPGFAGARIEDDILVTRKGAIVL
ncbi:MAG: Xaa-Pro peptidase family protein [Candidatus Micrarchaeaceae archaeon]